MLPTAHQPHEPCFYSVRRPSSFPGASIYYNSCPSSLEHTSSWWFPQSSSSSFLLLSGLPGEDFSGRFIVLCYFHFFRSFFSPPNFLFEGWLQKNSLLLYPILRVVPRNWKISGIREVLNGPGSAWARTCLLLLTFYLFHLEDSKGPQISSRIELQRLEFTSFVYTSWNLEWLIASRRTWLSALGMELTSGEDNTQRKEDWGPHQQ